MAENKNKDIKKVSDFLRGLDENILDKNILGSKVKVRHVAIGAAFFGAMASVGTDPQYAEAVGMSFKEMDQGSIPQILLCGAAAFGMLKDGGKLMAEHAAEAVESYFKQLKGKSPKRYDEKGQATVDGVPLEIYRANPYGDEGLVQDLAKDKSKIPFEVRKGEKLVAMNPAAFNKALASKRAKGV